jgi:hypothetical protein
MVRIWKLIKLELVFIKAQKLQTRDFTHSIEPSYRKKSFSHKWNQIHGANDKIMLFNLLSLK